jgi:hypothetical protein
VADGQADYDQGQSRQREPGDPVKDGWILWGMVEEVQIPDGRPDDGQRPNGDVDQGGLRGRRGSSMKQHGTLSISLGLAFHFSVPKPVLGSIVFQSK